MGWTLEFLVSETRSSLRESVISRYFASRARTRVDGPRATYRNADTGVSFQFEFGLGTRLTPKDGTRFPQGLHPAGVIFSLSETRSHVFALEADIEIRAFVSRFGLFVDDRGRGDLDGCAYSQAAFFRAFERLGAPPVGTPLPSVGDARPAESVPMAPDETALAWRWNYSRAELEGDYLGKLHVPRAMFARIGGDVSTAAIWEADRPAAIPRVDYILCTSSRQPMSGAAERRRRSFLVPHDALLAAAPFAREVAEPSPHHIVIADGADRFAPWQGLPVEALGVRFIGDLGEVLPREIDDIGRAEGTEPAPRRRTALNE